MATLGTEDRKGQLCKSYQVLVDKARRKLESPPREYFSDLIDKQCSTKKEKKDFENWLLQQLTAHADKCVNELKEEFAIWCKDFQLDESLAKLDKVSKCYTKVESSNCPAEAVEAEKSRLQNLLDEVMVENQALDEELRNLEIQYNDSISYVENYNRRLESVSTD